MAGAAAGVARSLRDAVSWRGRRPITGLSIEGNDLRVICVSGRDIIRFVNRALPPELMPGGVVTDRAAFGAAVRAILNEYELPHTTVAVAFPDTDAIIKRITLPKQAGTKIAEVVQREARRDPVMASGDYRIYYQTVSETQTAIGVFVLAVRGAALDSYLAGLKQAAIAPQMVELRPLAMIRAVNQPHTIIAHVERTALDVVIVSNNIPAIMRSVPLPASETDAALVDIIIEELSRTIESYNSDHPHPLHARLPVMLTGELSALPDLQAAVTERVARPIAALACPFTAPPGFAAANFIVNIGLALKAQ